MLSDITTTERSLPPRKHPVKRRQKRHSRMAQRFIFSAPAVAHSATSALTLPTIVDIPTKAVHQYSVESTARIALSFLDSGMACADDLPYASTPSLFIDRIFKRWIAERTSHLVTLSPHFILSDSFEPLVDGATAKEEFQIIVGINYSSDDVIFCSLKDKIESLETALPGLGETALRTLYGWLCRMTLAISPDFVHSLVQQYFWCGGDDENEFIENMLLESESAEDIEVPLTLADFEKDFPKYVYMPCEAIKKPQLSTLTKHPDPYVAEVASFLLIEPNIMSWEQQYRPTYLSELESSSEGAGYSIVLNWAPQGSDITSQVGDDWLRYALESGATDLHAAYQFSRDKEGIEKLFASLEQFISALTWVDKAISLLSTPEER